MPRRRAAWLICLGLIACGGGITARPVSRAQEAEPSLSTTVLIESSVAAPAGDPLTLSAASITLSPGQTSMPVVNTGVLLLVVESGSVTLTSDRPVAGRTPEGDGAVGQYRLSATQRVSVPTGATFQLSGAGPQPARLFVLSLFPADVAFPSS
jgi:hypothetical protein